MIFFFRQESLNVKGDVASTCETAGHFFMSQILTRWERFEARIKQRGGNMSTSAASFVNQEFPFHKFFDNAPQPLFKQESFDEDNEIAQSCFRYLLCKKVMLKISSQPRVIFL